MGETAQGRFVRLAYSPAHASVSTVPTPCRLRSAGVLLLSALTRTEGGAPYACSTARARSRPPRLPGPVGPSFGEQSPPMRTLRTTTRVAVIGASLALALSA